MTTEERLITAREEVVAALSDAIVAWRGSQELRDAIEDLLIGTPFEKPMGRDEEGLYGRLRNALGVAPK